MKISGNEVKGPAEEILVLPRLQGEDIVIRATAVMDMETFETLCPPPKPPGVRTKNGHKPNPNDKTYLERMDQFGEQRLAYTIVKSLEPSEIEWENVSLDDPSTWIAWKDEFKAAGISVTEVNRIVQCVMQANALDEDKLEAARANFLLGLEEEVEESSGLVTEPQSTPSGEPVKDSE